MSSASNRAQAMRTVVSWDCRRADQTFYLTSSDWRKLKRAGREKRDSTNAIGRASSLPRLVLAIEDRPLLRAFDDGALLALDLLTGGLVDARFLHQQFFENLAHLEPDGIPVLDEIDRGHVGHGVGDDVGQLIHFVTAQSHNGGIL